MKKSIVLSFMLLSVTHYIRGQGIAPSTLNVTGGSKVIAGYTYEWSIGEMTLVNTASASNVIVTQGVLQPKETPNGIKDEHVLGNALRVFPNPSSGIVNLQYNLPGGGTLTYMLQDVAGKLIQRNEIPVIAGQGKTAIDLTRLANATYMLYIYYQPLKGNAESTSFKLDKIN